jgi:hypothetical protein
MKRVKTPVLILDPLSWIQEATLAKHIILSKSSIVEESKKGYTGDALALRGEERRDKLR